MNHKLCMCCAPFPVDVAHSLLYPSSSAVHFEGGEETDRPAWIL